MTVHENLKHDLQRQKWITNELKVKSAIMLIEKSKVINDFVAIKMLLSEIEKREKGEQDGYTKEIIESNRKKIDFILEWRDLEEIYKRASYEYAEITALLFY